MGQQHKLVSALDMKPATLRPFLPRPALRRRVCISRSYAVQSPGLPTLQVFNRHTKYLQRERAAANTERSRQVDYLKDEVAMRLSERLLDINRHFDHVLDLGANSCNIARALTLPDPYPDPTKESAPLSTRLSKSRQWIHHEICSTVMQTSPSTTKSTSHAKSSTMRKDSHLNQIHSMPC